jgi:hypothetical protein
VSTAFRALDLAFCVHATHPVLQQLVEDLYAPCATDATPTVQYTLVERNAPDARSIVVFGNEHRLETTSERALALAFLVWQVSQRAIAESSANRLLLHAAAAEHDRRAVLLPAPSESGKSTLVAGLAASGFRYLTDDIAPVTVDTWRVQPYPKPIAIAADTLHLFPKLAARPDEEAEYIGEDAFLTGAQLGCEPARESIARLVVVPQFAPDAEPELTELTRAATLVLLAEQSFNFAQFGSTALTGLAQLLRECRCYRLRYRDLDAAVQIVSELLLAADDSPPSA